MSDEFREKIAGEITLAAEPGKTIRKWREEFGLSQYELADAMEMCGARTVDEIDREMLW